MKYDAKQVQAIIAERVTGKIEAAHDESGHHYLFVGTGITVDSVTQRNILDKPHLIPWAIRLAIEWLEIDERFVRLKTWERDSLIKGAQLAHKDYRDIAGTIGGEAHAIIEEYERLWMENGHQPPNIKLLIPAGTDYHVVGACRSAEAVFNKYDVTPVAAELLVGHPSMGAGTLDLIVLNKEGELELWDHKTSNQVNDFYACQVSAYKKMFEKMTGLKITRCRVLKIDKFSDRFKVYNVVSPWTSFLAYMAISKVYDWLKNGKEKLVEDKIIVKL